MRDDVITAISVVSTVDDEPYLTLGKEIISRILSAQSTDVDTVSGATFSSTGIKNAVKSALENAKN
ncbi:MAG: FMN-binding protein [Oscillospiraceae bacterium]|nr:FMN-binding protein [Oscillospiraceae bacterium]